MFSRYLGSFWPVSGVDEGDQCSSGSHDESASSPTANVKNAKNGHFLDWRRVYKAVKMRIWVVTGPAKLID